MGSVHLRDLGQGRRFHAQWPHVDTQAWPGRELYWVFTHPALSLLLLVVSVIVLGGYVHRLVGF